MSFMNYYQSYARLSKQSRKKIIKKISVISGLLFIVSISLGSLFFIGLPFTQADTDNDDGCKYNADIVFIIDRSTSMRWENFAKIDQARAMANELVDYMDVDNDQSALVSFATDTTIDKHFSNNHTETKSIIDGIFGFVLTKIGSGIKSANE